MVPPAIAAAEKRQAEKDAEAARKLKEEQERKEKQEREEREAQEAQEAKEREEREQSQREAEILAANVSGETAGGATGDASTTTEAMEGVESAQSSAEQITESAAPAVEPEYVMVAGREVDISRLGIDREYLLALPEELREEVLVQQITENRTRAAEVTSGTNPSGIDPAFLEALPPHIRAEVLQQEAQESRRREREEARRRNQANDTTRGEEMDTASFLASLEPALRQAVLMDQEDRKSVV